MRRRAILVLVAMGATLVLSSGVALAATITCQAELGDCFGTKKADTLNGTDTPEHMFGRASGDTLNAFGEEDWLFGNGGGDELFGGLGRDQMTGGSGKDELAGGGSDDHYHLGPNWGDDSITEGAPSGNDVAFNKGPYGADSHVYVPDDLTIRLTPGAGPEVKTKGATNTVNWEGHVIDEILSGNGDDTITGDALANNLDGGYGKDTIFGAGGDDHINVADGSGGDSVDCGEDLIGGADNDTVFFDAGDTVSYCETQNP
jgi:serralysin